MAPDAVNAPPAQVARPTEETLRLLRRLRRRRMRQQGRQIAYWIYVGVLASGVYGGWAVGGVAPRIGRVEYTETSARVLAAAPPALVALGLLLVLIVARDALWRGPVMLALPDIDWLLPAPIGRGRLLRPRLRRSVTLMTVGGALVGVAVAAAMALAGLGGGTEGVSATDFAGLAGVAAVVTGLLTVCASALAVLVEEHPAVQGWLRRATPVVAACVVALGIQATFAWAGHPLPTLAAVELWSGPWGWFARPVLSQAGAPMPAWPAALGLLGAAAAVFLAAAHRHAARIPAAALRARARTRSGVAAAVQSYDPRQARMLVREASADGLGRRSRWLRPPRAAVLAVPWRDCLALRRQPPRLAWAVGYIVASLWLGTVAAGQVDDGRLLLATAATAAAAYLAAAQLTEPARLEADDPRRAVHLPYAFGWLALTHAAVPVVVLFSAGIVVAAALSVSTVTVVPFAVLAAMVPPAVAATLVSAYRGPLPQHLFVGVETPVGSSVPFQIASWYAAAPLALLALMAPALAVVFVTPTAGKLLGVVLWGLAAATLLAF